MKLHSLAINFINNIIFLCSVQGWNDLNQLIKISDLNRDLNQMIFLLKKSFDLNPKFD